MTFGVFLLCFRVIFVLCCQLPVLQKKVIVSFHPFCDLLRVLHKVEWLQRQAVHRRSQRSQSDAPVYSTDVKTKRRPSRRILHSSDSVNSPWFNVSQPVLSFFFFFLFLPSQSSVTVLKHRHINPARQNLKIDPDLFSLHPGDT